MLQYLQIFVNTRFRCLTSGADCFVSHSVHTYMGVSKIGVPQNGWFIREHPIRIDDLGVPLFSETPI